MSSRKKRMDSLTSIDDEEAFFGSYEADRASVEAAQAPLEWEVQDQPVTPERLAHLARFRKPVAAVIAGLSLLSLVALAKLGYRQPGAQRELVAHYSAALAAPASAAPTPPKRPTSVPDAS